MRFAGSRALGAVSAQVGQALGSFLLQIVAAWSLGATGLATFALGFGVIIICTGFVSGMIGDSLTVLDRHDPATRTALLGGAAVTTVLAASIGAVVLAAGGVMSGWSILVFGLACAAFVAEELLRRLHMALLDFWRLIVIDLVALLVALCAIALAWRADALTLTSFFTALGLGQVAGALLAWLLLPPEERRIVRPVGGRVGHVLGFGVVRGFQVSLTPIEQNVARTLVVMGAGGVALGNLEGARLYVAPALLVTQGLNSYLMAMFAKRRNEPVGVLISLATRASLGLIVSIGVVGAIWIALEPVMGGIMGLGSLDITPAALIAWICYAMATASVMPLSSLAVTRGAQRRVLMVRVGDVSLTCAALAMAFLGWDAPPIASPLLMAAGVTTGGLVIRGWVLRSLARSG